MSRCSFLGNLRGLRIFSSLSESSLVTDLALSLIMSSGFEFSNTGSSSGAGPAYVNAIAPYPGIPAVKPVTPGMGGSRADSFGSSHHGAYFVGKSECCPAVIDPMTLLAVLGSIAGISIFLQDAVSASLSVSANRAHRRSGSGETDQQQDEQALSLWDQVEQVIDDWMSGESATASDSASGSASTSGRHARGVFTGYLADNWRKLGRLATFGEGTDYLQFVNLGMISFHFRF